MHVEELKDRSAFQTIACEWDTLVSETGGCFFLRHEFLRIWLDNFAASRNTRVLLGRDRRGRLVAAMPLVEGKSTLCGLPVRELRSASNAHSCRFDLLARDPIEAGRAFFGHLVAKSGWDLLCLRDVPDGGAAAALLSAALDTRWAIGTWQSLRSPYLALPTEAGALEAGLSRKFLANLRRRWRRLEEQGEVTAETVRGGPRLEEVLMEGLELEAQGWKGRNKTAILQDRATWGFYVELARAAARAGTLALSFLRLSGKPVAFHFAIEAEGRRLLLKPAYDERLAECSPGQLLTRWALEECVRNGLREFDFLGPDMPWKRDWTSTTRPHRWLYALRPGLRGRLLGSVKFDWIPRIKEALHS